MKSFLLALVLSLSSNTTPVQSWGKEGHEIVANIAYQHLSPKTQSIIQDILQIKDDDDDKDDDLSPLAKIANWADEIRIHPQYKYTAKMHYVDVHDDAVQGGCHPGDDETKKDECVFEYERDCEDDVCAVGAIVNFTKILSGYYHHPNGDDDEDTEKSGIRGSKVQTKDDDVFGNMRQTSLKFLTHIMGDVHQPLHVSRTSDRGGNDITVKLTPSSSSSSSSLEQNEEDFSLYSYPTVDRDGQELEHHHHHGHSHNLHSIWDTTIIEHAMTKFYGGSLSSFQASILADLSQYVSSNPSSCMDSTDKTCASTWANESWDYALNYAYANVDGTEITSGAEIDEVYLEKRLGVVKKCLGMGGLRLAKVLEEVLNVDDDGDEDLEDDILLSLSVRGAVSS